MERIQTAYSCYQNIHTSSLVFATTLSSLDCNMSSQRRCFIANVFLLSARTTQSFLSHIFSFLFFLYCKSATTWSALPASKRVLFQPWHFPNLTKQFLPKLNRTVIDSKCQPRNVQGPVRHRSGTPITGFGRHWQISYSAVWVMRTHRYNVP